jgi:hypothetical protein
MGADCCGCGARFDGLSADYKRRPWLVIAINAGMLWSSRRVARLLARRHCRRTRSISSAMHLPIGVTLAAIGASLAVRARAALFVQGSHPEPDGLVGVRRDPLSLDSRHPPG